MKLKKCPRCGRELPPASFHKNSKRPDGLAAYCKDCMKKAVIESTKKHEAQQQMYPHSYCEFCRMTVYIDKALHDRLYHTEAHA